MIWIILSFAWGYILEFNKILFSFKKYRYTVSNNILKYELLLYSNQCIVIGWGLSTIPALLTVMFNNNLIQVAQIYIIGYIPLLLLTMIILNIRLIKFKKDKIMKNA